MATTDTSIRARRIRAICPSSLAWLGEEIIEHGFEFDEGRAALRRAYVAQQASQALVGLGGDGGDLPVLLRHAAFEETGDPEIICSAGQPAGDGVPKVADVDGETLTRALCGD